MPSEATFLAALLVGFLGSTHCIGMCGGIAGASGMATTGSVSRSLTRRVVYLLAYNSGRILSYALAGFMAATLGRIGLGIFPTDIAYSIALSISIVFLLGLGSYLAGWWSFLPRLERFGAKLWRIIEPWGRRLLPVQNFYQAFLFGVVWGWLPCGLVYSVLAWAIAIGEPATGVLMMVGFGLGTLPTLLCLGMAGQVLHRLRRNSLVRQIAGITLIVAAAVLFGLYTLDRQMHEHHQSHASRGQWSAGSSTVSSRVVYSFSSSSMSIR